MPSCAVGGVPNVGPSGSVQEPPAGSPHDAFVVGHEEARVEISRANERVQAAITARVHVGVRHRNAMIECRVRTPLRALLAGFATRQRVSVSAACAAYIAM